jgi:hypothetical protein
MTGKNNKKADSIFLAKRYDKDTHGISFKLASACGQSKQYKDK